MKKTIFLSLFAFLCACANAQVAVPVTDLDFTTSSRFAARITASGGAGEEITAAQAKTLLAIAQADVSGLTTASSPTFVGATFSGAVSGITTLGTTGRVTVNNGQTTTAYRSLDIAAGAAGLTLQNTAAAVDNRIWDFSLSGTEFRGLVVNDALSVETKWLSVTRSGTTPAVSFPTGLNSTAIGATTPSTGAFTTLSATGDISTNQAGNATVRIKSGAASLSRLIATDDVGDAGYIDYDHATDSWLMRTSGTARATVSSSGLAVTGAITTTTASTIGGGITNDGSGFKHARVTTGSISAGSTALVTITWGTAFADANYTVSASVVDSTTSSLSLSVVHVESVSASAVTVRILNNAVGSLTGTVNVIAIHD